MCFRQTSFSFECGRFSWPSPADGTVTITPAQLGYLLEGIDWRMPQRTWRPQAAGLNAALRIISSRQRRHIEAARSYPTGRAGGSARRSVERRGFDRASAVSPSRRCDPRSTGRAANARHGCSIRRSCSSRTSKLLLPRTRAQPRRLRRADHRGARIRAPQGGTQAVPGASAE